VARATGEGRYWEEIRRQANYLFWYVRDADARPAVIRELAAFRAAHVDGLGPFAPDDHDPHALLLHRHHPADPTVYSLPWTARIVRWSLDAVL
jgi:hypothetical protein